MTRQISLVSAAVTAVLALLCWAIGTMHQAAGCVLAGTLMGTNLAIIAWALKNIFQKKSVALAVTVIVIKYAALLGLFILFYSVGWQINFGFIVGAASIFPTVGIVAYQHYSKSEQHGSF
jgi:hypothetical protein